MQRVMFVCLGNICRSPLAEGAFRAHLARRPFEVVRSFEVASAGTAPYHVDEAPDPRSVAIARRHGVDITAQRGRHLVAADLRHFDHVICMDRSNRDGVEQLLARLPAAERRARISLLLEALDPAVRKPFGVEVPDPYYGGPEGFAKVWTMVDAATAALLDRLAPPA